MIGSDETLKGDTFGGIVVAAVKVDPEQKKLLENLGVKDSKRMTDNRIKIVAKSIREAVPHHIINCFPREYNKRVAEIGLTSVLNEMHAECTGKLKSFDHKVVVDKYPGCNVEGAECVEKAEDKYIEVAAASILARAVGIIQFQELSLKAGIKLPLGSTHVTDALLACKEKNLDFHEFAKTSFRNVRLIMEK